MQVSAGMIKDLRGKTGAGMMDCKKALKETGGLVILKGSLAPEGCVVKVAGHERMTHRGPARVFEREEDALHAVLEGGIRELLREKNVLLLAHYYQESEIQDLAHEVGDSLALARARGKPVIFQKVGRTDVGAAAAGVSSRPRSENSRVPPTRREISAENLIVRGNAGWGH